MAIDFKWCSGTTDHEAPTSSVVTRQLQTKEWLDGVQTRRQPEAQAATNQDNDKMTRERAIRMIKKIWKKMEEDNATSSEASTHTLPAGWAAGRPAGEDERQERWWERPGGRELAKKIDDAAWWHNPATRWNDPWAPKSLRHWRRLTIIVGIRIVHADSGYIMTMLGDEKQA